MVLAGCKSLGRNPDFRYVNIAVSLSFLWTISKIQAVSLTKLRYNQKRSGLMKHISISSVLTA